MFNEVLGLGTVTNPAQLAKGSRLEFDAFIPTLPAEIQEGLKNGVLKLADKTVIATKPVDGKTIRLIESQDTKETGLRSLDRGRLPKGEVMVVSGIQLLAAITTGTNVSGDHADEEQKAITAKWFPIDQAFPLVKVVGRLAGGAIATVEEGATTALASVAGAIVDLEGDEPFAALETGLLSLRANGKDLLKELSMHNFKKNPVSALPGFYKLDNPRVLADDVEIKLEVELGEEVEADGVTECIWIKAVLIGTGTVAA